MTSSPGRTPPPDAPIADAEIEDERSSIRPRHQPVQAEQRLMAQASGGGSAGGRRPSSHPGHAGAADARVGRIDQKIRIAQILLSDMPADDPRARLLRVAIVRRDEVLIDAILEEMEARAKAESIAPPAGDPTTGVRKRRDQDE